MLQSTAVWLGALALVVSLITGGLLVRHAVRVGGRGTAVIVAGGRLSLVLALASLGSALLGDGGLAPVLALVALPLIVASVLLFVMRHRRIPLGTIRLRVGACLPRFQVQGPGGLPFDTAELRGQRVLMKFYRGHWCPFCSAELRQFEALRPELEERGIRVLAISKDSPAQAAYQVERDGLGFPLFSDPELRVIRRLGLEHRKALEISGGRFHILGFPLGYRPRFTSMATPTTLLIDEHGRIRSIDQSDDYQVRADATRVMEAVERAFGPSGAVGGSLPALPGVPDAFALAPCP